MKKMLMSASIICAVLACAQARAQFMSEVHIQPTGQIQCPTQISVKQEAVPAFINGWAATPMMRTVTLKNWTIYEGKLGDKRYAQAPSEIERHGKTIQIWNVGGQEDRREDKSEWKQEHKHYKHQHKHHKQGSNFWIACNYSDTPLTMQRQIPVHIRECRSTLRMDKWHNAAAGAVVTCE